MADSKGTHSSENAQDELMALKERLCKLERENKVLVEQLEHNKSTDAQEEEDMGYINRVLMNNTPDHVYFKDLKSRFIQISKAQADIFCLNDPAEAIGKTDFDFFTSEHAQQAFDDEQRIIKTGEPLLNIVEKETWPDGSITWVSTTKVPLCDTTGEIIGTFGISRDITDQKRAEDALNLEKALLRTLIDNIPDHIYVKDTQCRKIVANSTEYIRLGFSSEADLIGKDDFDIFPKEIAQEFWEVDQGVLNNRESIINVEDQIITPDGSEIWLLTSKMPLLNTEGVLMGLVGIGRDITDFKLAERALKESEEKFRTLFESMTEIAVIHELVFDSKGKPINYRITDCNRAFTKIIKIPKADALGNLATEVYGVSNAPYLKEYADVVIKTKPVRFEAHFIPLDKYFSISAVPLGNNKFATISLDVTYARHAQEIIEAKNKELEQIVYVASHDLRSPLVNIEGYSKELEFSLQEIKNALNPTIEPADELQRVLNFELPEMDDSIKTIRSSARNMDRLLKGLLKLSRLGRAALSFKVVDMNRLVKEIFVSLDYQIKGLGIDTEIGELPPCRADVTQLNHVFNNLISNAIKYLDPEQQGFIKVSGSIVSGRSEYCVEDNGIGIATNKLDSIFEVFHRLNPEKNDGEGLGLTIVRQVLSRLKGSVRVESELGRGSRFYVSLPYQSE